MSCDKDSIEITIKLIGTIQKNHREYSLRIDPVLNGKKALQKIKQSIKEKGVRYHYQILVNGKFAHTEMKEDISLCNGDEVKVIPVLGGG
jgi:sulfur carrier protein ThiS